MEAHPEHREGAQPQPAPMASPARVPAPPAPHMTKEDMLPPPLPPVAPMVPMAPPVPAAPAIGVKQPPPTAPGAMQSAIGYLDRVKMQFQSRPEVYSSFLDIMKQFKTQTIDTEGVIQRVQTLFHGHNELILGFNQFLPPGYEIGLVEPPPTEQPLPQPPQPVAPRGAPTKPTVEFNHAVNYVAKIKKRFEDVPHIYEQFLQILHAYQEQRTSEEAIDEVKEKVHRLFRGHSDLLSEFHYFLPEVGPEPAPTRGVGRPRGRRKRTAEREDSGRNKRQYVVEERYEEPARIKRTGAFPPNSKREVAILEAIKSAAPRATYVQFLRLLHLYNRDIVDRGELVVLLEDLFDDDGRLSDLLDKFKDAVLDFNEWEEIQNASVDRSDFYSFIAEMGSLGCRVVTPSYRELPQDVARPTCTGRSALCDSVLNDDLVSMPTGTEDQSFNVMRKNQYEEALFRCEDERYEMDRLIETNKAAMKALRSIETSSQTICANDALAFQIDKALESIHLDAIARLYGDQWVDVMLWLRDNPARATGVLYTRLEQKTQEWEALRSSLSKTWRLVVEQNHYKSKDHRSFYFKQEEKKRLTSRSLLAACRSKADAVSDEQQGPTLVVCHSFLANNSSIHTLIDQLVSHVAHDECTEEELEHVTALWSSFVLPFFQARTELPTVDTKPVRVVPPETEYAPTEEPFNLFFGGSSFFCLFRLYQLLYERLALCKEQCDVRDEDTFEHVMEIVTEFCGSNVDTATFEDEMRDMAGAGSYVLFTVDRVVSQIIKQLLTIVSSPVQQKLLALYSYEQTRAQGRPMDRRTYLNNRLALLDEDTMCSHVEYLVSSNRLVLGVVANAAPLEAPTVDSDTDTYLATLLRPVDATPDTTPFLKRTRGTRTPRLCINGLETRLHSSSFKMHFVQGTADLLLH